MDLPKARGRLLTIGDRAVLVARCPFCGAEHRYDQGPAAGPEVAELTSRGYSDEWLPCQFDLPGNFWRIFVGRSRRRRGRPSPARPDGKRPGPGRG